MKPVSHRETPSHVVSGLPALRRTRGIMLLIRTFQTPNPESPWGNWGDAERMQGAEQVICPAVGGCIPAVTARFLIVLLRTV
jgi:hypothetical protein